MNKRNKIIISIVGITMVLLALLGVTYAYYLTRIEGNTNTNSIGITTADLKIEYRDGNGIISAENIMPGDTVGTKTFTVTNKGNTTIDNYGISLDYAEIVKDNKIVVPSIFERPEDFEITLTCKDNNNDDCNGYTGNFNNESIIVTTSSIEPNEVHNYSLTIHYANPDIDQSNDMGKNLNLKVNIFSVNESADINGTITGVDSTYALKVNSEPKLSTIVNGKYKLKGLEVGTHTLSIIDNNGNVVKSQKLVIETGDNPGISETTVDNETVPLITINENSRVAPLNTTYDKTTTTITNTGTTMTKFNPYENNKNTLAYNIINNALNTTEEEHEQGYSKYTEEPLTIPSINSAGVIYNLNSITETTEVVEIDSTYKDYYWTYGAGYKVDKNYGFKLIDIKTCKYNDCYQELVGKYIVYKTLNNLVAEENVQTTQPITRQYIYQITGTTMDTIQLKKMELGNNNIVENILTKSEDDHGISYYYRGNVKDNYVNFAGMCWRIVRIAGDGSIKLILEDAYYECDSGSYTGNYSIGSTYYGYKKFSNGAHYADYLNPVFSGMADKLKDYQITLENKIKEKDSLKTLSNTLKVGDWCYDDRKYSDSNSKNEIINPDTYYINNNIFSYGARIRIGFNYAPTFKCTFDSNSYTISNYKDGTKMFVSTITADEASMAGGKSKNNTNYYLINQYQLKTYISWWTLTPNCFNCHEEVISLAYDINYHGGLGSWYVTTQEVVRPAIQLLNGTEISGGNGTQSDPYVIK